MKILCLCRRGNSRSVALAWLLKDKYKQEAIATGMNVTSRETRKMLFEWADLIILMIPAVKHWIPEEYNNKVKILDVGADTYFRGFNDSLINQCEDFIRREQILK